MGQQKLTPFGNALAGAIGGMIANAIVYPLDTVKTKIQAESSSSRSETNAAASAPAIKRDGAPNLVKLPVTKTGPGVTEIVLKILKEQGIFGFYSGFSASMLNTFSMQFAYFYWYTIVRTTYCNKVFPSLPGTPNKAPKSLSTATELALGAVAGAFAQIFTIPVSVIATRQQLYDPDEDTPLLPSTSTSTSSSTSASTSSKPKSAPSIYATAKEILREDGITGLWRGLKPSLVLTVNPAITYGMFERFKNLLLNEGEKMTPQKAFLIGALSKTMATVVTYPYIMAKVRLQAKYTPPTPTPSTVNSGSAASYAEVADPKKSVPPPTGRYKGAIDVLIKVYKKKGFAGWYQGMQAQITKAVLAQALLFGIKDYMEGYTLLLMIAFQRFRARRALRVVKMRI